MLEIKNLNISINGKEILKKLNLKLDKGIYVLKGKNGIGKTTLANALMGNPKCKINSGGILLNDEDITEVSMDERAKKGLFVSYQNPIEIPGISVLNFLRTAFNSLNKEKISMLDFQKMLEEKASSIGLNKELLERNLNVGFSGGEKKKMEILQMLVLEPKIVILDEVDSGLDSDSLEKISKEIKKFSSNKTLLIITHYDKIINSLNPKKVFIMESGEIIE
jgi:Fe-S cluster assembly ATP-binding protein